MMRTGITRCSIRAGRPLSSTNILASSMLLPRHVALSSRYFGNGSVRLRQQEKEDNEDGNEDPRKAPRDSDSCDVLIIGAGPSGLAAAIKIKQLAAAAGNEIRVCVLEKGAEVGMHILSGAVIEPRTITELIPDWKEKGAPLTQPALDDSFVFLTETSSLRLPTPPQMNNHGNYIVSLSNVTKWLGEQATELGVEIYPGTPAAEVLYNEDGSVKGVATVDRGLTKSGQPKDSFSRGFELHAPITLFSEGCRGSLTKTLTEKFNLRAECGPQTFGLGIKELWQVDNKHYQAGKIVHTTGWPMDFQTYGGSWMYHMENNLISIGFVIGLDYTNPYLNPYREFQRFKHHPFISKFLEGGSPVGYGARALVEGGYQAIPKLNFPGGALIGDCAGFMNVPKIKGSHTAMKSGMVAAEAVVEALANKEEGKAINLKSYPEKLKNSWLWDELYRERNIRPAMAHFGLVGGIAYSAIDTFLLRGKAPWTFKHSPKGDHGALEPASKHKPIEYPKPDGKLSFTLLENVSRSGTNHPDNQECHLKIKNPSIPTEVNLKQFAGPESRYCPAGVYEYVDEKLVINYQNCVHCKTCDIKDPTQNINWVVPEEGGPLYANL